MSRFEFLNKIAEAAPRFSPNVSKKAEELYAKEKVVENPFNEYSLRIQGTKYFYTVTTDGTKAIKCDCQARRRCYHMAIVDKYLGES